MNVAWSDNRNTTTTTTTTDIACDASHYATLPTYGRSSALSNARRSCRTHRAHGHSRRLRRAATPRRSCDCPSWLTGRHDYKAKGTTRYSGICGRPRRDRNRLRMCQSGTADATKVVCSRTSIAKMNEMRHASSAAEVFTNTQHRD